MKPLYDELLTSYFDTITIENASSLGKDAPEPRAIHPPEMGSVVALPSSADCTTATNDGLPERARIKPCRYWLSTF